MPDGSRLPNPLLALPELLKVSRHVRVGEIHGDLNLENIMVDPAVRDVSLIDFAEARRDHVLHDFLRLETEIMTKLVAELCHQHGLAPAPLISYFYQQAHWAAFYPDQYEVQPFHPALAKPLAMLMLIRQTARQFFFKVNDPTEYYQGLALYMLGALKFTNLKHAPEAPLPKQIAFWGAAVAVGFYTGALEQGVPDCPYRGLEFFDVQHAPYFFGREALTRRLLTKIEQALEPAEVDTPRFLAIIGPSGSGKSSLARAGLVAAIQRGEIRGSRAWPVAIFRPGVKPLASLAQALTVATPQSRHLFDPPNLAGVLAEDEHALHLAVRQLLSRPDDDRYCVLLVDQFEEIFTLCRDETDRLALLANLRYAATSAESRTIVLLTLRADFYGKCAAYPALAQLLSDHQALVGPMLPDELRRAIEAPARQSICFFEAGLPQKLLDDVQSQAGGLPLLQYALRELWGRQDRRRLTHTAYEAIGRATGALQQRAEAVYEHLTETERQICRRLFLRLTQPGEETEDTKRRVAWPELLPAAGNPMVIESVVRRLAAPETRLIVITGDKEAVVEVAHEALIRNWPRLQGWLDEDREAVLTHRRLTEAALEWQRHDQDASYLYRDSRLGQAEAWAVEYGDDLNALERDFLTASLELRLRQEAAEQARQQKELAQAQQLAEEQRQRAEVQTQAAARLRRRAIWLAAILILLLLAVIAAIAFGFQAQNEADRADANLSTAQYRATQESLARGQAVANLSTAQYRATQEAQARGEAVANLATAQFRATLEAEARNNAEAAATLEALARADADSNLSTAVYRATLEAAARSQAAANLGTAQANATLESLARSTAVAEATRSAQAEQTAQAEATNAIQSEQTAQAESTRAIQAEQTA
ncbi:MAG: AAA family ATPase, partial [Anaerolineales bacterium]|nr:AAA family ATPase [Anaerolineales bacterium]